MRALLAASLLLINLTCREPLSVPAYLVGPAALVIVVADNTPAINFSFEAIGGIASPGDSLCLPFQADGNWHTVLLWNDIWPFLDIQWVPHQVGPTLALHFSGTARSTKMLPTPAC